MQENMKLVTTAEDVAQLIDTYMRLPQDAKRYIEGVGAGILFAREGATENQKTA